MSTVVRRVFRATPHRDAHATWTAIVDLLTRGRNADARRELLAAAGTAASLITDQAPKDDPIIVTCEGPRTRIYCLYDDDALDGADTNEDALAYDPLGGDWAVSLPCPADDLAWVQRSLAKGGTRVTARGPGETPAADARRAEVPLQGSLVLDPKGFLGR